MDKETKRELTALKARLTRVSNRLAALEAGLIRYGISADAIVLAYRKQRRRSRRVAEPARPEMYGLAYDYLSDWNALAASYGWRKISSLTKRRAGALNARESEDAWDWSGLIVALAKVDHVWLAGQNWWGFDRLIMGVAKSDGEEEYIRVLEGKYDRRGRATHDASTLPELE